MQQRSWLLFTKCPANQRAQNGNQFLWLNRKTYYVLTTIIYENLKIPVFAIYLTTNFIYKNVDLYKIISI